MNSFFIHIGVKPTVFQLLYGSYPPILVIDSSKISSVRFYLIWTPFDMDILRNQKHATDTNWHWALDQYVSPKNNIKSCQKVYES